MSQELRAEVERLTKLNDGLSRQIIGMGATLEESRRELLATGWDECAKWPSRPKLEDNPYRKPVIDFSGAIFCKTGDSE